MEVFITLVLLVLTLGVTHAGNEDEVKSLPGVNFKLPYAHFSGYLEGLDGNYLHYWFFESQRDTVKDPIVLWLNGGPGCSSVMGALTEIGPLRLASNNSLALNPFAWNLRNSLLFIESPAGVGFSFNAHNNYTTGDDATAANNFAALQSFFHKYPHLKENDFYITGESYGGVYVPTLSVLVSENKFPKNFKGFAIGNAYLDETLLSNSALHFVHYHGIIDDVLWDELLTNCCHNVTNTRKCNFFENQKHNIECAKSAKKVDLQHLNPYNIYDKCYEHKSLQDFAYVPRMLRDLWQGNEIEVEAKPNKGGHMLPCLDQRDAIAYLNQEEVKKALHIDERAFIWAPCTHLPYREEYKSTKEQVHKLVSSGLKALIYNGDVDLMCNFLGDMWFVEELGFKTTQSYAAWMHEGQIAGYAKKFGNLTYTTIRGSGHLVPSDRPGPAQYMFYNFFLN